MFRTAVQMLLAIVLGTTFSACTFIRKNASSPKVYDARKSSLDMNAYQQAYQAWQNGQGKMPLTFGLNITSEHGGSVLGTIPENLIGAGTPRSFSRGIRGAVDTSTKSFPTEGAPEKLDIPSDLEGLGDALAQCPADPGGDDSPTPTPSATPTEDTSGDDTGGDDTGDGGTTGDDTTGGDPPADDTTRVATNGAIHTTNRNAIRLGGPGFFCPLLPGGGPFGPPVVCPPGTWPVVNSIPGNPWAVMTGCTNGLPASACSITFSGPFGPFVCNVNLFTGFWFCSGNTPPFGVYPIIGWVCL